MSRPLASDTLDVHAVSDLDGSVLAQHHTLGKGNTQSSPGGHRHTGSDSYQLTASGLAVPSSTPAYLVASPTPAWQTRLGAHLRRAASQSVTQNVTTSIAFDTADENLGNLITIPGGGSASTITIPALGVWAVMVHATGNVDAAARFLLMLAPTSVYNYPSELRAPPSNGTEDAITATWSLRLAAGDTLLCRTFHSSVAAVNMTFTAAIYRTSI